MIFCLFIYKNISKKKTKKKKTNSLKLQLKILFNNTLLSSLLEWYFNLNIIYKKIYYIFKYIPQDTTATFLTTAMYYLAKYPDIQEKLRKESLEVISDPN